MGSCVQKQQKVDIQRHSNAKLNSPSVAPPFKSKSLKHLISVKSVADKSFDKDEIIHDSQEINRLQHKRLVVEGVLSSSSQQGFEDKCSSNNSSMISPEDLSEIGISVTCKKGLKQNCPNQDDYFINLDENSLIIGVFDGHGPDGHSISNYVKKYLCSSMSSHPTLKTNPMQALKDSFTQCHNCLVQEPSIKFDISNSGTTATVLYLHNKILYTAHVGDSRAVIAQQVGTNINARNLTTDHRLSLTHEQDRIKKCGGEIRRGSEHSPLRLYKPGEMYPGLNLTRTLGDAISHDIGVSSDPDIQSVDLVQGDQFILLCSDGVWEFITSQEAVNLVNKCEGDPKKASEKLSALAWMRWKQHSSIIVDDITIIVVYLQNFLLS